MARGESDAVRSGIEGAGGARGATPGSPPLVAIGASTGGPRALAAIAAALPEDFAGATVVVQHVDRAFAPGLASWIDLRVAIRVKVAEAGDRPESGTMLLAASNDHLVVRPDLSFGYTDEPLESPFRPSIDVFFDSLLKCWPERSVAVLLTGMGRDGARGLLRLRRAGWHTIAQGESGCAASGMPQAAIELGAAVEVLALERIGDSLVRRLGRAGTRNGSSRSGRGSP